MPKAITGSANQNPLNAAMARGRNMAQLGSASMDGTDRGNDDLINFLEQKLEQAERNMIVKQQEYDALLHEHQGLQAQFN